jgi:hypothetical protein
LPRVRPVVILVDVAFREQAPRWAAKIAADSRWAQKAFRLRPDPTT